MAKLRIFGRCQRIEYFPLVIELILYVPDTRQIFDRLLQLFAPQMPDCTTDFVNDQLDPELCNLVLDYEQHFVMVRRVT